MILEPWEQRGGMYGIEQQSCRAGARGKAAQKDLLDSVECRRQCWSGGCCEPALFAHVHDAAALPLITDGMDTTLSEWMT